MVELLDLLGIFIDIRRIHIQVVLYVNYGISFKWINKPLTNQLQRNRKIKFGLKVRSIQTTRLKRFLFDYVVDH